MTTDRRARQRPRVSLAPLIRPQEHGVYGLWAEPVLLGSLLAPSWAGLALALAGASAVVAQQPAALALADLRRGRRYPRTVVASRIALALGLVAAAGLAAAAVLAARAAQAGPAGAQETGAVTLAWASAWWLPLALAAVPAAIQLGLDRAFRGKTAAAQVSGAVALAGLAPAIALAGGASAPVAWAAWGWLILRIGASVPTVRARLRRARGREAAIQTARLGAAALPLVAVAAALAGYLAAWTAGVAIVLGARALWTLRRDAPAVPPARIGVAETVAGLAWIAALTAGIPR